MSTVKIKICGLRRREDIEAVNEVLPEYVGFVFAQSRRQIDANTAAGLKKLLDKRIKTVGVFVNQSIDFITGFYKSGVIDLVQLHGEEDGEYIARLRNACGCGIIKSVSIADTLPVLPQEADYLLFDTASDQRGGAGVSFNWDVLENYTGKSYFLAGGLVIENVTAAVQKLHPFCVDVSSGVETDGFKDPNKIIRFVQTVRRI